MKYKLIFILAVIFFSCSTQKVVNETPAIRIWEVVSVQDGYFTARYGRTFAKFKPVDSVWVGKKIKVSSVK